MSKHLNLFYYEPAGSKETPEELNERLQHILHRMATGANNRNPKDQIQSAGAKIKTEPITAEKTKVDSTVNKESEPRIAGLKQACKRTIKSNTTCLNDQIKRNIKKIAEFRTNETTANRNSRLIDSLKEISEVKQQKEQKDKKRCTNIQGEILDGLNESDSSVEALKLCNSSSRPQENDEIENDKAFNTLLSFFLKQEHKPPIPQTKREARMKDVMEPSTSRNDKPKNIGDIEFHTDKQEPLQKMDI